MSRLLPLIVLCLICCEALAQDTPFAESKFVTALSGDGFNLIKSDRATLISNGYARTGVGASGDGTTQAYFQMPEAGSKYRVGNEPDHYFELDFRYHQILGRDRDRSLDVVWAIDVQRDYGKDQIFDPEYASELYIKMDNLLGRCERLWVGRRNYDRRSTAVLDRYWLNPGQGGLGVGIEGLLNRGDENRDDLKVAAWIFDDRDILHYDSYDVVSNLFNYTTDIRWVNRRIGSSNNYFNVALNYTVRPANEEFGYEFRHGFGIVSWLDHRRDNLINTTALILRQGANVVANHGTGRSIKENQFNDRRIIADLRNALYLEVNNSFTYDTKDRYALTLSTLFVMQDFGTLPYWLEADGSKSYIEGLGKEFFWFTAAVRGVYYFSDYFRLTLELSSEYGIVQHIDAEGFLNKVTFTPEFTLHKGIATSPRLRPFITYAAWGEELKGWIGNSPSGAGYGDDTSGFTYGLQLIFAW